MWLKTVLWLALFCNDVAFLIYEDKFPVFFYICFGLCRRSGDICQETCTNT